MLHNMENAANDPIILGTAAFSDHKHFGVTLDVKHERFSFLGFASWSTNLVRIGK